MGKAFLSGVNLEQFTMSNLIIVQGIVVALAFIIYRLFFLKKDVLLPLPPGPKPLPILGNINDLPPPGVPEFEHWLTFKDKYGPVSSLNVLGQTMLILHDSDAVMELMEKTSMKTSARPQLFFATEMCGFGEFLPAMGYDDVFRQHRRYIHQQLGTKALAARFSDIQDVESKRLLLRALKDPQNLMEHIKAYVEMHILFRSFFFSFSSTTSSTNSPAARRQQSFSRLPMAIRLSHLAQILW